MVNAIKQFFDRYVKPPSDVSEKGSEHSLQVATAALLIELMRADAEVKEDERTAVTAAVREKFKLSSDEVHALLKLAEDEIWDATGFYEFTSLINKGFNYAQKVRIIAHMWEVAFADASLDKHEEHMIRKIADLLYIAHKDFIETKLRVRKTAGR